MAPAGYNTYQRTQIATADRRRIVVLLYEGAISRLSQARAAIADGEPDLRVMNVNKALDIVHFLNNGLDFQRGGEIAGNLRRLYDYIRDIVSLGSIEGKPENLNEAIRLLSTLLGAWRQIASSGSATTPPSFEARTREMAESISATG